MNVSRNFNLRGYCWKSGIHNTVSIEYIIKTKNKQIYTVKQISHALEKEPNVYTNSFPPVLTSGYSSNVLYTVISVTLPLFNSYRDKYVPH